MRVKDQYYMNSKLGKPSSTNPFDYILFDDSKGEMWCLELKSTQYKSIGYQLTPDEPEAMIKAHQLKRLLDVQQGMEKVHAGLLLQFREEDKVYYIDINDFLRFTCEVDRKSITPVYCLLYGGKEINTKKLRTHISVQIGDIVND